MNTPPNPQSLAPFSCTFSPNLPELLTQLRCTIVISTYQAGKVVFISPKNEEELVQLPRTFYKAMGIALRDDKMAVATKEEVVVLRNSVELAQSYPKRPHTYDALWMPRATYYTGGVDIHDLHFGKQDLWAVNTSFSCLCTIDDDYSFMPRWQPPFITELASEDRCHLNGLAMEEENPAYVTALGRGNTLQSWRENITESGIIMHVPTNEIVLSGLPMPHTPRLYDGQLYVLLSAKEELIKVDLKQGTYAVVAHIPGFVRGMAKQGDFLFVATSKLRKNSSTFRHLSIADKANVAGVVVLHLPTGAIVGKIEYQMSVDEIYDVQILPDSVRPNIVNTYGDVHHKGLMIPDTTFWAKPQPDNNL